MTQELNQAVMSDLRFASGTPKAADRLEEILHIRAQQRIALQLYKQKINEYRAAEKQSAPRKRAGEICITPREREVLALMASGKTTKEIAQELGISFRTAACHRGRIFDKLCARNIADATRAAIRMGLVEA